MATQPFWQAGLRFTCQGGGACCTSRGEYGFVYVSDVDVTRLAEAMNLGEEAFRAQYCATTDGYLHLRDPDQDCLFLDGQRCNQYEARPTQCRTWPFWSENLKSAKTWRRDVVGFCPGAGEGRLYSAEEIAAIVREYEETSG